MTYSMLRSEISFITCSATLLLCWLKLLAFRNWFKSMTLVEERLKGACNLSEGCLSPLPLSSASPMVLLFYLALKLLPVALLLDGG